MIRFYSLCGWGRIVSWGYKLMLKGVFIVYFFLFFQAANADEEMNFLYSMCFQGFVATTSMPKPEIKKTCECTSHEVKNKITPRQRNSIKEFKRMLMNNKPPPIDLFQRTGLKNLINESQNYCVDLLYPVKPEITDKDHKNFSLLANKSVKEFGEFVDRLCGKYPQSKKRESCVTSSSIKWLQTKGKEYEEIPSIYYITGNDIAKNLISNPTK